MPFDRTLSDFHYGHAFGADGLNGLTTRRSIPRSLIVIADRGYVRDEIIEDASLAGFVCERQMDLRQAAEYSAASGSRPDFLADLTIIDCPVAEVEALSVLDRAHECVKRGATELIVSTSMGSLDDVFGTLRDRSVQILVTPTRAERVMALGRSLSRDGNRVRELSTDVRIELLRLTEQVGEIAQKLETLSTRTSPAPSGASVFAFDKAEPREGRRDRAAGAIRMTREPLPDPRLVRKIIHHRHLRARYFDSDLFADPVWDMLLDLTAARAEHVRVSVSSLCIASGVPSSTALRWIKAMSEAGLVERIEDDTDRRRAFLSLSDQGASAMSRYFAELGPSAASLI